MEIIPSLVPVVLLSIPFLVTMAALHIILFKPLFAYLEEREGLSTRARLEATELNQSADQKLASIEQQLADTRRETTELRKDARAQARQKEAAVLAEARQAAEREVDDAVGQIAEEKKRASATLRGTAKVLSTDIAAQVLGRQPH